MELECLPKLQSLEVRLQEFLGDSSSAQGASDSSFPPHAEVSQTAPAQIKEVIVERLSGSTGAINSGGGTGQVVHVTPDTNTVHRIVVLLIDDQRIIGESLRQMLQNESDIQFHFCQDPMKAIEIALEIRPTVILQDLVMPELDGLGACAAVSGSTGFRQSAIDCFIGNRSGRSESGSLCPWGE